MKGKLKERLLSLLLVISMVVTLIPVGLVSVKAADTSYRINAISDTEKGVYELAKHMFIAKGIETTLVYKQSTQENDIVVNQGGSIDTFGEEGYSISVDSGIITVNAATDAGVRYGLNDVLSQLEKGTVTNVDITEPFKGIRSLFVDCGRKYFGVSWFEEIIREMSWNGMNTLYLSFSNDEGFRFLLDDMSLSFDNGNGTTVTYSDEFMSHIADNPQSLSNSSFLSERNNGASNVAQQIANYDNAKRLTEKDMERILAYAKAYGITVIPEFNSPGHMGQLLWYFPNYRNVGIWGIGSNPCYALNLENSEAKNFATALIKKYVDFFAEQGITDFCVGGDEFANHGSSNETIAAYVNNLVEYVESKGMTAYAWNDGQATTSGLLKKSVVVNCWNAGPVDGYSTVNFNGNSFDTNTLYYVLKGHDGWRPNPEWLYSTWTPLDYFNTKVTNSDSALGASVAIWCDVPNYETTDEVLSNMKPIIRAFGYKMWNYPNTEYTSYNDFKSDATESPYVDATSVLKTVGYNVSVNPPVDTDNLPEPSQGVGYELVTFNCPTVSTKDGWYSGENNLIDGNTDTVAWTGTVQDAGDYIRVDLGKVQTVNTVTVTSPADKDVCTNANVEVSSDGISWETIGQHTGSSEIVQSNTYTVNSEIRYIQIKITAANDNWWKVSEISWNPKETSSQSLANGTYIIVNNTNKAMSSTSATHNSIKGQAKEIVSISNNIATPINSRYEWTFEKQSDGTYYIKAANNKYLNIVNLDNVTLSDSPQKISVEIANGKVMLYNGSYSLNYYVGNGQIFSSYYVERKNNDYHYLYKKLDGGLNTNELYNLILDAERYSNDDHRYGSEEFFVLQSVLQESISLYRNANEDNTTVTQENINAQTEKLRDAIETLELSDTTMNYIEIPVEILDFRADGVLFEYDQNHNPKGAYDLLKDWASGLGLIAPGTAASQEGYANTEIWRRQGLIEPDLVNGKIVYKQETVEYVAALINAGVYSDLTGTENSYGDWTHSTVTKWNTGISNKVKELQGTLGTWKETLAKTDTTANGGYLEWDEITTSTDLAYYVLTNLFRCTESDDTDSRDTYNTAVSSIDRVRLLYDAKTGLYTLNANYQTQTLGGYVYNTDLSTETSNNPGNFDPIKDLGYEGTDYNYGDNTDAANGQNFHFTMHAFGSFVYYADQDLYFEFTGDDDVYFFINGKLAMDIGAAHGPCSDNLRLNDIADELGLLDGEIYTFDMFYAERHTTASNLKFSTNIKIMDTMSTTSKGQYNANTGENIAYGAVVKADTTVAYSFNLMNLRSVKITDISFIDESLGSNLSKNNIVLYDSNKTNGATTNISDIIVYYHTYDRPAPTESGTLNTDELVNKSVSEITDMINGANAAHKSLDKGSYVVSISSKDELKSLLELGLPIDTQIRIYGVKRTVTKDDTPYINTITSRAYYESNGKKVALNGVANQKVTVLHSFNLPVDKEKVVIDYGKSIKVGLDEIKSNIDLRDNTVSATFCGITNIGSHEQIRLEKPIVYNTIGTNNSFAPNTSNGSYQLSKTELSFKLDNFLSNVEKVYAVYEIADEALKDSNYKKYYLLSEIDIIPATIVYYETDFADGVFTYVEGDGNDEDTIANAWAEVGTNDSDNVQNDGTIGNGQIYGSDSTYGNDNLLSDGSSMFVQGEGRNLTQTKFSFTGTGFDLISRTGKSQGAIRVDVYSDASMKKLVKAVNVINKSESNLELYQIPVVSINNLDHGTYYVKVGVMASNTVKTTDENGNEIIDEALSRGNEFFFDALRIYDPINVNTSSYDANISKEAYMTDGEFSPEFTEVRSILLNEKDYESSILNNGVAQGVLFVDRNKTSVNVSTYSAIGPNNEVYLKPGQAIAFKIYASTGSLTSIQVGAKSADGSSATLHTELTKPDGSIYDINTSINTSTSLFYSLTGSQDAATFLDDNGYVNVMITNNGEADSILSITDIKVGYSDIPSAQVELLADEEVKTFASFRLMKLVPNYDIIDAKINGNVKILRQTTMNVTTTTDVTSLRVINKYGFNLYPRTSYVDNEDGTRTWTIKFTPLILGKQRYSITGYGKDGTSGTSLSINVNVKLR